MSNTTLIFLPICINPSNPTSVRSSHRIQHYIQGLTQFFALNNDILLQENIDIIIFDNTIEHISEIPKNILDIIPSNVQILTSIVNNFGCYNKGAGLIESWLYNMNNLDKYEWIIHFEPRQFLESNQFIDDFIQNPRNLFTINVNVKHFNTGLFCIQSNVLLRYIRNINLLDMVKHSISIEDDLYHFFQCNNITFDTLEKMDLIWFPDVNAQIHY